MLLRGIFSLSHKTRLCYACPGKSALHIYQKRCLSKIKREEWRSKQKQNSNREKWTKSHFNLLRTKGMLSFYTGISHEIQIAPFAKLVINTSFIVSVILLHIWAKYGQSQILLFQCMLVHLQEWSVHMLRGRRKLSVFSTCGRLKNCL